MASTEVLRLLDDVVQRVESVYSRISVFSLRDDCRHSPSLKSLANVLRSQIGILARFRASARRSIDLFEDPDISKILTSYTGDLCYLKEYVRLVGDVERLATRESLSADSITVGPELKRIGCALFQYRCRLKDGARAEFEYDLVRCISSTDSIKRVSSHSPTTLQSGALPGWTLEAGAGRNLADDLTVLLRTESGRSFLDSPYDARKVRELRNHTFADYPRAASNWPRSEVNTLWSGLKNDVFRLLPPPWTPLDDENRALFSAWILEVAAQAWPKLFGSDAISDARISRLRSAMSSSAFAPLQVAAAFGFYSYCSDVLTDLLSGSKLASKIPHPGNDASMDQELSMVFYFAILGPCALRVVWGDDIWDAMNTLPYSVAHLETLRVFLAHPIDISVVDPSTHGLWSSGGLPIAPDHVSFLTSLRLKSSELAWSLLQRAGWPETASKPLLAQLAPGDFWGPETRHETASPQSLRFLDRFLDTVLSSATASLNGDLDLDSIVDVADSLARHLDLDCVDLARKSTIRTMGDEDYCVAVRVSIVLGKRSYLCRLIRDPRWDPNMPYQNDNDCSEDEQGEKDDKQATAAETAPTTGTILHLATEQTNGESAEVYAKIVADLIASGSDVHRRDSAGRTPLLLCETPEILERLVQSGADIGDRDYNGRNIYHYAAANNDLETINFAFPLDPYRAENIQIAGAGGSTPFVLAIDFVHTLKHVPLRRDHIPKPVAALGIRKLISNEVGHTPDMPWPIGLLFRSVEWGDIELYQYLVANGCDPTQVLYGESLLHRINFSASPELVDLIANAYAGNVPLQRGLDRCTPLETVFYNTAFLQDPTPDLEYVTLSDHPSCHSQLSKELFMRLLDLEMSLEQAWLNHACPDPLQRLAAGILPSWTKSKTPLLKNSILVAAECLMQRGYFADYEDIVRRFPELADLLP